MSGYADIDLIEEGNSSVPYALLVGGCTIQLISLLPVALSVQVFLVSGCTSCDGIVVAIGKWGRYIEYVKTRWK